MVWKVLFYPTDRLLPDLVAADAYEMELAVILEPCERLDGSFDGGGFVMLLRRIEFKDLAGAFLDRATPDLFDAV